jgi:PLP dependent protein
MGIASNTDKEVVIKGDFNDLKNHFTALKQSYFKNRPEFKEISMGMSSDYELACSEGSTMIRVGSLLFGSR